MGVLSRNGAYVAARAKSRKRKLIDSTRFRQLVQQTPEQLAVSIADSGYRQEIDKYASGFKGSDLIEVGLTHNLEVELANIIGLCSGEIRNQVEIYTGRFRYHNAKVVMRASFNDMDSSEIAHAVLPEENEINVPWLKMVEEAAKSGVDAVKIQIVYSGKSYTKETDSYAIFKKVEMPADEWEKVIILAKNLGIDIFATFTQSEDISMVEQYELPAIKISSSNINNFPLLMTALKTGKPLLYLLD